MDSIGSGVQSGLEFGYRLRIHQRRYIARIIAPKYRAHHAAPAGPAGLKPDDGHGGAVTLIERFGRAANLNMHLHCLVLDGVYRRSAEGAPQLVEVAALSDEALEAVLLTAPVNRHASCGCEPSMDTICPIRCCNGVPRARVLLFRPGLGAGLHGAESALGRVGYGGARRYARPMDRACRSSATSFVGQCYAARLIENV